MHFDCFNGIRILSLATTIVLVLFLFLPALGQSGADRSTQQTVQNPNATQQSEASTEPLEERTPKRGEFVFAPIPISSPALGSGLIPVGAYIFPFKPKDAISPPSVIGAAGLITDNDSRAFLVAGQLFMREDTYRVAAAFFQGNLNYNLYGVGVIAGNEGAKLPLKQDGSVFFAEFLRQVKWRTFVGPRVLTGHSVITQRAAVNAAVPLPPDLNLQTSLTSLGFTIERDTRANRFYPTNGTVLEVTADFFADAFGSKYSFQSYKTTFNKYIGLSKNQVLAFNAHFCATGGRPPFYGNCIYGTNNELRGYEAGRYLDPYMFATQLEYRLVLPMRFGLVGFGGIGGVGSNGRDFLRGSAFLPAGGGGLRFILSRSYHLNLRADIAAGKNEHTFSLGVSEAF